MSAAMDDMRHEKPAEYVRVMFSILPKELTVERAVEGLEDEELELLLAEMRERRAKRAAEGSAPGSGEVAVDATTEKEAVGTEPASRICTGR
jgi:hypothetical protein